MKKIAIFIIVFVSIFTLISSLLNAGESKDSKLSPVISFGTLPVLQALPIFVAAEKDFFKEQGLNVNLVRFNSAMEKDVALSAGQISGYFGDIMTPMVLNANKTPAKMIATIFNTSKTQRMFAIIASPKHSNKSISEIAREGIAVSSNTILDYLMTKLLKSKSNQTDNVKQIEIKSIPIRLQMLLSGQIPAAMLPEPLVTLAEQKGCKVLIDDAGADASATVLVFNENFLADHPDVVKKFLAAVEKASQYTNKHRDEVRSIMNRECRVPDSLQKTFPIPEFRKLTMPDYNQVMDVYQWLRGKKIIKTEMTFKQMVGDGYLP
ncbi:MAG: MetQ/NlpA family ABC transporter substrate-binding protein [Proteobacteria bacterium]|nr:MetQ/NlpA family ABC transporter substrate-binding protein [Pseudomonadota bacterium]